MVCWFVILQAAVYGQDSWSREEVSSEVREREEDGGVTKRQSHVRRVKSEF